MSGSVRHARGLRITGAAWLLAALSTSCASAPGTPAEAVRSGAVLDRLDDEIRAVLRRGAPGVGVMLVAGDSLVFERWTGAVSLAVAEPMSGEVVVHAGEVVQLVTGLAAAHMAARGELDLDEPVGTLVPELPDAVAEASVDELLHHTGGLSHRFVRGQPPRDDLRTATRWITDLDVVAQPGSFPSFSKPGLVLAAHALEVSAGASYADAIAHEVFEPLGMTTSTVDAEALDGLAVAPRRTLPPEMTPSSLRDRKPPPPDSLVNAPVRGLFASGHDLARLAAALLTDGVVAGERRLPAGVADAVMAADVRVPWARGGGARWVGLGAWHREWEGRRELRIMENVTGHSVLLRLLPDDSLGVLVISPDPAGLMEISEALLRPALGLGRERERTAAPALPPSPPADAIPGTYRNGTETLVIEPTEEGMAVVSGNLRLPAEVAEGVLRARLADGRVLFSAAVLQDPAGVPYLYFENRALRRVDRP